MAPKLTPRPPDRGRMLASLPAKIGELRAARLRLRHDDMYAAAYVRHLVGNVAELAMTFGLDELAEAATSTALVKEDLLASAILELEGTLAESYAALSRRAPVIVVFAASERLVPGIAEALSGDEVELHFVLSRRDAELALARLRPNLLIVDLGPPDADARAFLARAKVGLQIGHTPTLVLVPRTNPDVKCECIARGVEHALDKPVSARLLRTACESVLRKRRAIGADSRQDALTGLLNRAGMVEEIQRAQSLADRTGLRYAVAIVDLDHFKDVNDTHGHAMGDDVLKGLGDIFRSRLRASDITGRWGGEEFVVLMPNTDAAGGVVALDKVKGFLRETSFRSSGGEVTGLTFSAGVVDFNSAVDVEDVVGRADELLYDAKAAGRDCILDAPPPSDQRQRRVLVVEDDPDAAQLICAIFESQGLATTHVASARAAFESVTRRPYELIVLDCQLPDGTGLEVLEKLRSEARLRRVPIMMLTSRKDDATIERTFELGGDDYLAKPFRERELRARVGRLLRLSDTPVSVPAKVRSSLPSRTSLPPYLSSTPPLSKPPS